MRGYLPLLLIVPLLPLAACTTASPAMEPALSTDMGDATRANIAAMAIEPTDAERANTFIPFDRERRAKAITDYREGTTPEPRVMSTRGE